MSILIGAKGVAEMIVTEDKTAAAIGSGSVKVFATPWMIAMMELSACSALAPYYEEGQSSVGTHLDVSHDAATPVGMKVHAEAEVIEVDRRRIVLSVAAYDEMGLIGKGRHERFLIDAEKFIAKAESKGK
ncbi:MAG: thioesterase family protein [Oscillospiraceae bacterium]|nr:thioesterase family protein [Oscillospiraceae bacterium]